MHLKGVIKMKKYYGYKIVWKSGHTYQKMYDKSKTENQLRSLAVAKVVDRGWNTHGFHVEYVKEEK